MVSYFCFDNGGNSVCLDLWTREMVVEMTCPNCSRLEKEITALKGEREALLEEHKVCTGCGHNYTKVGPPHLGCCPDGRYRTAKQLLTEFDFMKAERDALAEKLKDAESLLALCPSHPDLTSQLRGMHQALEWYADDKNWDQSSGMARELRRQPNTVDGPGETIEEPDMGYRAYQALKALSSGEKGEGVFDK